MNKKALMLAIAFAVIGVAATLRIVPHPRTIQWLMPFAFGAAFGVYLERGIRPKRAV